MAPDSPITLASSELPPSLAQIAEHFRRLAAAYADLGMSTGIRGQHGDPCGDPPLENQ